MLGTEERTTELKLARFPARSPLPFAVLPSIALIPSARLHGYHGLGSAQHIHTTEKFIENCKSSECAGLPLDRRGRRRGSSADCAHLKLAPFPSPSPLPVAALPSISLIPSARFRRFIKKSSL